MARKVKYAIGIFIEGSFIHMVCLMEKQREIRLIDAQISKLTGKLETVDALGELVPEMSGDFGDDTGSFDHSNEDGNSDILLSDFDQLNAEENVSVIHEILNKFADKKYRLALSLAEPQIYYTHFNSDWGLKGDKLKKRVIEELSKTQQNTELLQPEDVNLIRKDDGRLLAIVRDGDVNILPEMEAAQPGITNRIEFIETAEIALVNLVKKNYNLPPESNNLLVYIGHEFSRLTFMRGNGILNISYIIGVGLDSDNIVNTIYSRILLEQDNLNITELDNIILTGQAFDAGIDRFLAEKFPRETNIQYLSLQQLGLAENDPLASRFAVPIGSALRILMPKDPSLYRVDLTPRAVREGKKKFKIGISGWIFLALIPLVAFFTTVKLGQQHQRLLQIEAQTRAKRVELAQLQEVELRLNLMREKLNTFDQTLGVLDSIPLHNATWSQFLNKVSRVARETRYIWITDTFRDGAQGNERVVIKGYSVFRHKIPQFANSLGNARLIKVEVQEIRDKTVYNFEIETVVDEQVEPATNTAK